MTKFVPREKLSKKARKELDLKQRILWQINPITRCPPNPRVYDRNKIRRETGYHSFPDIVRVIY